MPDGDITAGRGQDTQPGPVPGEVVVLQPGDERAQKIGKAIASQTANDTLHSLQNRAMTATGLAEALNLPMGTVKYHIENLLEAGLLEVRETRYSVKGREVKVYGLRDQLLIVAPRVHSIRSILLKYASLFGITALASLAMYAILPLVRRTAEAPAAFTRQAGETVLNATPTPFLTPEVTGAVAGKGAGTLPVPSTIVPTLAPAEVTGAAVQGGAGTAVNAVSTAAPPPPMEAIAGQPSGIAIAFFLGGCLIILLLLIYEVYTWRKSR